MHPGVLNGGAPMGLPPGPHQVLFGIDDKIAFMTVLYMEDCSLFETNP